MKNILWALLLVGPRVFCQYPYVPFTETISEQGYDISLEVDFFSTSQTSDFDAQTTVLKAPNSFSTLNNRLKVNYGLTDHFELNTAFNFRINTAYEQTTNYEKEFTKGGVESLLAGFRYSTSRSERVQYAVSAYYALGMFTNDTYDPNVRRENIVLGDEGDELFIGAAVSILTKSANYFELEAGFRSPPGSLSNEVVTNTRFTFSWKKWALYAGLEYVYSLVGDEYTETPLAKPEISTTTELYNSINREYASPYIGAQYALKYDLLLELKGYSRMFGRSTDLGFGSVVSITKRVETSDNFKKRDAAFKQYEVEGVVTKITTSRTTCVVDKGVQDGLKKGDQVDFYYFDFVAGDELIGKGVVLKASYSKSFIKITKKYTKKKIRSGTIIRAKLVE